MIEVWEVWDGCHITESTRIEQVQLNAARIVTGLPIFSSLLSLYITKTCLYNFDPLKPHFFIVRKLGFTGVYIVFLISAQKHRLWYSLESPCRGGSNEYPQSMFLNRNKKNNVYSCKRHVLSRNMKNIRVFYLKIQVLEDKFSIYLKRRVFVMSYSLVGNSCRKKKDKKININVQNHNQRISRLFNRNGTKHCR